MASTKLSHSIFLILQNFPCHSFTRHPTDLAPASSYHPYQPTRPLQPYLIDLQTINWPKKIGWKTWFVCTVSFLRLHHGPITSIKPWIYTSRFPGYLLGQASDLIFGSANQWSSVVGFRIDAHHSTVPLLLIVPPFLTTPFYMLLWYGTFETPHLFLSACHLPLYSLLETPWCWQGCRHSLFRGAPWWTMSLHSMCSSDSEYVYSLCYLWFCCYGVRCSLFNQ